MNVLTFDLEVENYKLNKRTASPFDMRNYIVQIGWNVNGGEVHNKYYDQWHREPVLPCLDDIDLLVGFNIKFDLLWVWREPELIKFLKKGGRIYCGQYVEYLLGGMTQDVQMTSMNKTAEQYGGGQKHDAVKAMWESGMLTSEIPRDLLTDYLCGDGEDIVGDVLNTYLIYKGQVERMKTEHPKEFMQMVSFRMDGLLATTEMEYNGMYVDTDKAEQLRLQLVEDIATAKAELETFLPELPPELTFNWGSTQHKSCLIFGGVVKYEKWTPHVDEKGKPIYSKRIEKHPLFYGIPVNPSNCRLTGELYSCSIDGVRHTQDVYKSGKKKGEGKFKNVTVNDKSKPKGAKKPYYFQFDGYTKPKAKWQGAQTDAYDNPLYSTSGDVIEELGKTGLPFTVALANYTSMVKDLGTYYWQEDKNGKRKGMLCLVDDTNIIHHKLNHTSTVTSRLSSSDPNLQNIPRGDTSNVKKMFKTRFNNGLLAEIDYSQLEVVVQGVLTGDPQLQQDLRDRVDFHCKRLSAKLGEDYQYVWDKCHVEEDPTYKKGRTNAKIMSFQRAYGAGVATVVESTGMSKEEVDDFIEAENRMYPKIAQFDMKLEKELNMNRIPTNKQIYIDGVAFTQGESHWDSPTGTRYIWREGITPTFMHEKGRYTGFSPTERKNYPMQGFGGEIVQTMLGKVFRYFVANDMFDYKALLINTVHDCVLVDGEEELLPNVAKEVQAILESVPETYNAAYETVNITVPFPCETEIGSDLYEMNVLH